MLPSYLTTFWHRVTSPRRHHRSQHCSVPLVQLTGRSPRQLPPRIRQCPVAMKYLRLLEPPNWRHFPNRRAGHYRGVRPASRVPFVAAYLVKIDQQLRSMGALNRYLREHPALAWLLGFDLRTGLPAERTWARTLRQLHNQSRQFLLDQSIQAIWRALPSCLADHPLADAVALDTKHILAWVKENNLKESIPDRFNKERQPKGDPDCKLGCKERHNQPRRHTLSVPTPTIEAQPASGISVGSFLLGIRQWYCRHQAGPGR